MIILRESQSNHLQADLFVIPTFKRSPYCFNHFPPALVLPFVCEFWHYSTSIHRTWPRWKITTQRPLLEAFSSPEAWGGSGTAMIYKPECLEHGIVASPIGTWSRHLKALGNFTYSSKVAHKTWSEEHEQLLQHLNLSQEDSEAASLVSWSSAEGTLLFYLKSNHSWEVSSFPPIEQITTPITWLFHQQGCKINQAFQFAQPSITTAPRSGALKQLGLWPRENSCHTSHLHAWCANRSVKCAR